MFATAERGQRAISTHDSGPSARVVESETVADKVAPGQAKQEVMLAGG